MFHIMKFAKIARICTYISLAAPLIASKGLFFPFITGKVLFFRVFTELALVAIAGAVAYGELPAAAIIKTVKKPLFIAITVFTGLFTLSAMTAQVPSFAFWSNFERGEGAWQIIHYLLFFFLIKTLFRDKNDWKRLIGAQAAIGTLVALYAVGQAVNWPSWIIDPATGRVSGTLGNPAYMGIYMAVSACFAAWLALESRGKTKIWWLATAAFEGIMFLMAQNRGSFAGAGIGGALMLAFWLFRKKGSKTGRFAVAALMLAVIGGAAGLIFTVKGGNALGDFQPRLWTWESALSGAIERPLSGWGPEHFPFVFDRYYNPNHYQIESWFDRAHDTPLEYLTIGGIPLFLAYAGIFALLYVRLFRKKNEDLTPFFSALPLMYAINGLVLFETLPLYLIFFLMIGLIDAFTDGFMADGATPARHYRGTPLLKTAFAITAIFTTVSLYATAYLPLRKNLLILEAIRTDGKTDIEIFQEHEAALDYVSPVGDEEELQGLLTFTVSYFEYVQKNGLAAQISKEKIRNIMKFNAERYAAGAPYAIGLKTAYIRTTGLLAAYQATKEAEYLEEADRLIAQSAMIAPTRIEFIRLAMASARFRNDAIAYAAAYRKGKKLLPELGWEPDMAKFVY